MDIVVVVLRHQQGTQKQFKKKLQKPLQSYYIHGKIITDRGIA